MAKQKGLNLVEKFDAVAEYLSNGVIRSDFPVSEMVKFMQDRSEKAGRKSGKKVKEVSQDVLDAQAALMDYVEANDSASVKEVREAGVVLNDGMVASPQYVSARFRELVEAGSLVSFDGKDSKRYKLA